MSTPLVRLWYAIAVACLSCVLIAVVSVQYANYVHKQTIAEMKKQQQQSDLRWCELLSSIDDGYTNDPPQTEAGKRQAELIGRLRTDFGCR
jgi:hypothetical protein